MTEPLISLEDVRIQFRMSYDRTASLPQLMRELARRIFLRHVPEYFVALDAINLQVRQGEILGVVGPNGGGKSTLLRAISGIYHPDAGRVVVRGRVSALLQIGTGFDLNLNGLDNIRLNGLITGRTLRAIEERIPTITAFADIGEFIAVPMKYYSTGMISRLSFATVLEMDPEILLVDETLSVGDLTFQEKSKAAMSRMLERAKCQVIVSHDLDFIERFCTRAIFISRGRIEMDDTPAAVVKEYRLFMGAQTNPASPVRGVESKAERLVPTG